MNRIQLALTTTAIVLLAACQPAAQLPAPSSTPKTPAPSAAPSAPVDPSPSTPPQPSTTPPTAAVPPAPTGVKIAFAQRDLIEEGYYANVRTTITWKAPLAAGTEIRVYGVTACFAPPEGGPCLVEHTALPENVRDLIAKAPASTGKVSWTWPNWENVGGAVMAHGDATYQAVVIAAYNATGHSKFIIVRSGEFCPDCTY